MTLEVQSAYSIGRGWSQKSGSHARLKRGGVARTVLKPSDLIEAIKRSPKIAKIPHIKISAALKEASSREFINMALIKDYMPPSRENYEWVVYLFGYYFPLVRFSRAYSTKMDNG